MSFTENSDTESNVEDAKSEANDISEPIKFAEKSEQINSVTETALENEISGLDNQASSSDVFQPNDFVDFSKENIETVCAACEEDLHFCDAETAIEDLFQASAPLEKDDLTKPDAVLFETGEEFTANQPQDTPIVLSELELDSPPNDDELACADLETQIDLSQQTSDDFDSENEIKISVVSDVKFEELISSLKSKGFDDKLPIRLVSDYRFLLGRTVTNNIYNLRKELIIEKNTQVTVPVVEHALRTGKLIELILNSRPI